MDLYMIRKMKNIY